MKRRVDRHRAERPPGWTTVEEPIRIADAARRLGTSAGVVLVECLTLWTSNLLLDMAHASPETVEAFALNEIDAIAALARTTRIVLVTNEVGSGIVPDSALCRRFQDLHGWINQRAAAHADEVFLIVSGLPLPVKPAGPR
jgi:adenosylcobinamide kinase/adenosylcobinamide-phosphate guanylyltransferase